MINANDNKVITNEDEGGRNELVQKISAFVSRDSRTTVAACFDKKTPKPIDDAVPMINR